MSKRTTIACLAILATALWACDNNGGTDAGIDSGPGVDSGQPVDSGPPDTGPADSGPPQPIEFGVRLANMIAGLTPPGAGQAGSVHICLHPAIGDPVLLTTARTLPYGGVSTPYFPIAYGIDYEVRFYDAIPFEADVGTPLPSTACADTTETPLITRTIAPADVTLGEFHTALATGFTAGFCTAASIDPCPPMQLDVFLDDYTAPTAGKTRIRIASGVVHVPVAVDVCAIDNLAPSDPPLVLGVDIAARDISAPVEFDPILGTTAPGGAPATAIQLRQPAAGDCEGAVITSMGDIDGYTGSIPTAAALVARAPDNIPATYDADTNVWIFIFPLGTGDDGLVALTVPWTETPQACTLLPPNGFGGC